MKPKERIELNKKHIGFVFQQYHLLDNLTVAENLDIPLSYRNVKGSERAAIVADTLDRFHIVGKKDLFPNQLSGGQQQLVGVARALIAKPKLILADEPTGNLHSDQGREIMRALQEAERRGHDDRPGDALRGERDATATGSSGCATAGSSTTEGPMSSSWLHDLRFALRRLAAAPGYTGVALVTLALGIGANAAIFSVVDAVLLRPLPYREGERLVMLGDRTPDGASANNVGYATYEDLRDSSRSFESMAAVRAWYPTLSADGQSERIPAMRVTSGFFPMLGASPALGRGFLPEEDRPDTWRVLLLSDGLWRRSFGADPSVVGRVVRLNDMDFRVAGVMPRGFRELVSARYYAPAELWAPVGYDRSLPYACRDCQHLKAIGRLAPGATLESARADLDGVRKHLAAEYPTSYPRAVWRSCRCPAS